MPNVPSNNLSQILSVLTKSELRHITLSNQFSEDSTDNPYSILFNLLVNQKLDNETLYERMKPYVKSKNHFNVLRHELFHKILKSMRHYPTPSYDIDMQIIDGIKDASWLLNRGMTKQAIKVVGYVKKLAFEYEKYLYILHIIYLESEANFKLLSPQELFEYTKNTAISLSENIFPTLMEFFEYEKLDAYINCRLQIVNFADSNITDDIDNMVNKYLKKNKLKPNLVESNITRHNLKMILNEDDQVKKNGLHIRWNELLASQENFIKSIRSKHEDVLLKSIPSRIISLYGNQLRLCVAASNDAKFKSTLKELKSLNFPGSRYEVTKMAIVYTYEQLYFRQMVRLPELKKSCSEVEIFLKRESDKLIGKDTYMTLMAMLIHSLFILEEFQMCNNYISIIDRKYKDNDIRVDILSFNAIIRFFVFYEMDLIRKIMSIVPKAEKFIKEKEVLYLASKSSIEFFKKITTDKLLNMELLKQYYDQLTVQKDDKKLSLLFNYFDAHAWAEAKLYNKNYATVLKRNWPK